MAGYLDIRVGLASLLEECSDTRTDVAPALARTPTPTSTSKVLPAGHPVALHNGYSFVTNGLEVAVFKCHLSKSYWSKNVSMRSATSKDSEFLGEGPRSRGFIEAERYGDPESCVQSWTQLALQNLLYIIIFDECVSV